MLKIKNLKADIENKSILNGFSLKTSAAIHSDFSKILPNIDVNSISVNELRSFMVTFNIFII